MNADKIEQVLNQFSESNYDRVIFDGHWGIGKTKHVKDFTKANPENSCYVSLFGKKSLNDIIEEIYFKSLQDDAKGKFKEYLTKSSNKLEGVNFSYLGISLSIPLLSDTYSRMFSELEGKQSYIIIFDDLERKNDELGLKELFGLIDHLGNIKGIRVALVAFSDKFNDDDKQVFNDYKEKSIDRIYLIDKYSENAPLFILETDKWLPVKNIAALLNFKNLRIFQKTKHFIEEVLSVLGNDMFSDKFTKEDIYKMCFATIVYLDEHNGQKLLLDEDIRNSVNSERDTTDYIDGFIIRNTLDNMMSKNMLFHIIRWYQTGEYDIKAIKNEIKFINSFMPEDTVNHLSSEHEILNVIEKAKHFFVDIKAEEDIENIIQMLNNVIDWADIMQVEDGFEKEVLLQKIKPNISNHVNIKKSVFENEVIMRRYASTGKNKASEIITLINNNIIFEFYDQLTDKIIECLDDKKFSSNRYLKMLYESVLSIGDYRPEVWCNIIKKIEDNDYFFPLPMGKVSQDHWDWCLINNELIKRIDENFKTDFFKEYQKNVKNRVSEFQDLMLQHRINLFRWDEQIPAMVDD
ncbi:KAP family NTPase [Bacillus pumilus]|uniref:hypothetical protein n=1 Tax=Bacillus pumilus TaxID=1408 RepID=UPI002280D1D1|nr:hypothetical protein [Bacillus pumilus]MCY7679885.1 KAP family NTPase [Bacillus pumilus]